MNLRSDTAYQVALDLEYPDLIRWCNSSDEYHNYCHTERRFQNLLQDKDRQLLFEIDGYLDDLVNGHQLIFQYGNDHDILIGYLPASREGSGYPVPASREGSGVVVFDERNDTHIVEGDLVAENILREPHLRLPLDKATQLIKDIIITTDYRPERLPRRI